MTGLKVRAADADAEDVTSASVSALTEQTAEARLRTLILAVQHLSLAGSMEDVQRIVRTAARRLVGADGATFVLKDDGYCYYADEDAIAPLWKGHRFPLENCISGWVMLNRRPAVIPDIYADPRIPHEAYRPTFVTSLLMVPVRTVDPIAAIGMYWAQPHEATEDEVGAARALADSTSVALDSLHVRDQRDLAVELSETDPLTGLPNRRAWEAALAHMPPGASVAVLDLDAFKAYNDAHGHAGGDALLADAAHAWRAQLRPGDVLARIGGEEFGLLLSGCDETTAAEVAERVRRATPRATASLGLATRIGAEDAAGLIRRADAALYAAKAAGRNRSVIASRA